MIVDITVKLLMLVEIAGIKRADSTAAYGLYDLDPVAGPKHAGGETAARDDFLVDLQCEAFVGKPEVLQECTGTEVLGYFPVRSVEDDMHVLASRKLERRGILPYSRERLSHTGEITISWRS
jgi:hypothetical protein